MATEGSPSRGSNTFYTESLGVLWSEGHLVSVSLILLIRTYHNPGDLVLKMQYPSDRCCYVYPQDIIQFLETCILLK